VLVIKLVAAFFLTAYLLEKMVDDAALSKWLNLEEISDGNVPTEHVEHN